MFLLTKITCLLLITSSIASQINEEVCYKEGPCPDNKIRYLFYDVNPPEGFNLRRDVYLRFAVLAQNLLKTKELNNFKLVLPPWSYLYHWGFAKEPQHFPWAKFFDLPSLKLFAPVIELHEYFKANKKSKIDEVFVLQNFKDMFETNNFEERMQIDECNQKVTTNFFYYNNLTSSKISCLSFHGPATKLSTLLDKSSAKTILIDHAEVALHEFFGNKVYWRARRSMRFNKELVLKAKEFRLKFLNSSDKLEGTILPEDWRDEVPRRTAKGGPYLAVHLRRQDFVRNRPKQTPSLANVAQQISKLLLKLKLSKVFVATDAPSNEVKLLRKELKGNSVELYQFEEKTLHDGEVAIIDQIICSHARYFIGSQESTFSFRIQEEREIKGFPQESTFNSLCSDTECVAPSKWAIVY